MTEVYLLPRLPLRAARSRLETVVGKNASELLSFAESTHPEMIFAATGGNRVDVSVLKLLREKILAAARELGFPRPSRQEKQLAFDPQAGRVLFDSLPILPGEASRDDFWSFLSLVLLPDVATWRFPDQNERRFLGGVRNVFQRLWWRAHLLRDTENADPWWLLRLPEDALVGLMERPGISSNPLVTRTIARGIAEVAAMPADVREDAWREAFKRIRQRFPIVNVDALPPAELERQIREICTLTMAARARPA
jgi:Family of unknown function (DUF6339)